MRRNSQSVVSLPKPRPNFWQENDVFKLTCVNSPYLQQSLLKSECLSQRSVQKEKKKKKIRDLELGLKTSRDVLDRYRSQRNQESQNYLNTIRTLLDRPNLQKKPIENKELTEEEKKRQEFFNKLYSRAKKGNLEKRAISQRRLKSNENIKNLMKQKEQEESDLGFMTQRLRRDQKENMNYEEQFLEINDKVNRNCEQIFQQSDSNQIKDLVNQYERFPVVQTRIKTQFLEQQTQENKGFNKDKFRIKQLKKQLQDLKNHLSNLKKLKEEEPIEKLNELKQQNREVKRLIEEEQLCQWQLSHVKQRENQQFKFDKHEFEEKSKQLKFYQSQLEQCEKDKNRYCEQIKQIQLNIAQLASNQKESRTTYEHMVSKENIDHFKVKKYTLLNNQYKEKVKEEQKEKNKVHKEQLINAQQLILKKRIRQGIMMIKQEKILQQKQQQFEKFRQQTSINDIKDLKEYVYNFQAQIENLDKEIEKIIQQNYQLEDKLKQKKQQLSEIQLGLDFNIEDQPRKSYQEENKNKDCYKALQKIRRNQTKKTLAIVFGFIQKLITQLKLQNKQIKHNQDAMITVCDLNTKQKIREEKKNQFRYVITKENAIEFLSLIGIKFTQILQILNNCDCKSSLNQSMKNNYYHDLYNCKTFGTDKNIYAHFELDNQQQIGLPGFANIIQVIRGKNEDRISMEQRIRDELEEEREFKKQYESIKYNQ